MTATNESATRGKAPLRLQDIAKKAGVSAATVSLVLNDKGSISEATRTRIKKLLADSGYVYDKRAAAMRTRRTYDLGVLLQDISNPYFGELLSGMSRYLADTRYLYLYANAEENVVRQQRLLESFMETGVDGAVVYLSRHTPPETVEHLKKWGRPVLLAFRHFGRTDFDYMGPDNYLGGKLAASALIRAGHKRIVLAGGSAKSHNRAERHRGYADALREAGLEPVDADNIFHDSYTRRDGHILAEHILAANKGATAAMFFNDAMALGAIAAFQRRGVEPGRDIGVFGFDDIRDAEMSIPPLCTVSTDPVGMGARMAEMLLSRVEDPFRPVSIVRERPRLVIRNTSGCREETPAGRDVDP